MTRVLYVSITCEWRDAHVYIWGRARGQATPTVWRTRARPPDIARCPSNQEQDPTHTPPINRLSSLHRSPTPAGHSQVRPPAVVHGLPPIHRFAIAVDTCGRQKLSPEAHLDRSAISSSLLPMKLTGCGALIEIAACTASDSADSIEAFLSR